MKTFTVFFLLVLDLLNFKLPHLVFLELLQLVIASLTSGLTGGFLRWNLCCLHGHSDVLPFLLILISPSISCCSSVREVFKNTLKSLFMERK